MNGNIRKKLGSLVIFRNLLKLPVIESLIALDKTNKGDTTALVYAYGDFMAKLLCEDPSLTRYLTRAVLEDENVYTAYKISGRDEDKMLEDMLDRELAILESVSQYDGADVRATLSSERLIAWHTEKTDLTRLYHERMSEIHTRGYGIFAQYKMFVVDSDGNLIPIRKPDPIKLSDLIGYEKERGKVIVNTEAFINGRASNNVLLYGDAGTGKSSTVKAIVNSMADRGLRLIELKKDQLSLIPKITEHLSDNPLKFIFFIDDLTFTSDDKDFCALKATLEGGVTDRGSNTVIYATSNHRHMIKESATARQDSVNTADMVQETVSLSARFGLTITYLKSDREGYAHIVCELAHRAGIEMDTEALTTAAEAFAIRGGGRNPRTAKQFVNMLIANS